MAIAALSAVDDSRAVDAVIHGLDDDDLAVVQSATSALLDMGQGMSLLVALTKEEEVATVVADLIADASPAWFETFLIELLAGQGPVERRVAAADALGFVLESTSALPALIAAAKSEDAELSGAAQRAADHVASMN